MNCQSKHPLCVSREESAYSRGLADNGYAYDREGQTVAKIDLTQLAGLVAPGSNVKVVGVRWAGDSVEFVCVPGAEKK